MGDMVFNDHVMRWVCGEGDLDVAGGWEVEYSLIGVWVWVWV